MSNIGIITINDDCKFVTKYLEHYSNKYIFSMFNFTSNCGPIFDNILKFKTFLKHQKNLLCCDKLVYISGNVQLDEFNFLIDYDNDKIKTINYSGDAISARAQIFIDLSFIINQYIMNDLSCDVNVNNWNYQINKYLKSSPNVENYQSNNTREIIKFKQLDCYYVTSHLTGGLGNLLFQIVATYSYSKMNNLKPIFCVNKTNNFRSSICKYRLFDKLTKYSVHDDIQFANLNEQNFFDLNVNCNIKLFGFFHDLKFISTMLQEICDILNYDDFSHIDIKKYFRDGISNYVSIHVRRTDYLKCNIYHILDKKYYDKAIDIFDKNNTLFLIFSDDIEWCKTSNYFTEIKKVFIERNLSDEEQMYLMSQCDHNIIANSTFSLWGAYLNTKNNKKIVVPKIWLVSETNFSYNNILNHEQKIEIDI